MPSPEVVIPSEFTSEEDIFTERLAALEAEAAEGVHSERPIFFMVGPETELVIKEPFPELWERRHEPMVQKYIEEEGVLMPDTYTLPPEPEEKTATMAAFHREATEYIAALPARNEAEEERKAAWLAEIPTMGMAGLINFRLYKEFAKPTLGETAPPSDPSLAELEAFTAANGWLEFRFGMGKHQEGWFDNPGATEFRLNPCRPSEAKRRFGIIKNRFIEIASEVGYFVAEGTTHLNMSAFELVSDKPDIQLDKDEDGKLTKAIVRRKRTHKSLLGYAEDRDEQNRSAVGAVATAIEDGAWLNATSIKNDHTFENTRAYTISHLRDTVRILESYLELRAGDLQATPEHGMLWLMGAVLDGQQRGLSGLWAENGHVPMWRDGHMVERLERFDKSEHLTAQRALERAVFDKETGRLWLRLKDSQFCVTRGAASLTGFLPEFDMDEAAKNPEGVLRKVNDNALALNAMAVDSLRVSEDGHVSCTPETITQAFNELHPQLRDYLMTDFTDPQQVTKLWLRFMDKVINFRVLPAQVLTQSIPEANYDAETRVRKLLGSNAMRLAYGKYHDAFVQHLSKVAEASRN